MLVLQNFVHVYSRVFVARLRVVFLCSPFHPSCVDRSRDRGQEVLPAVLGNLLKEAVLGKCRRFAESSTAELRNDCKMSTFRWLALVHVPVLFFTCL